MHRRDLIKTISICLAGAAISGKAVSQTPAKAPARRPGFDADVIIIGGGMAGVTTARELRKGGYSTILLEARDRLGGRTFSSRFAGEVVEMGGTWIHQSQPFVWAERMRYRLDIVESPGAAIPDRVVYRERESARDLPVESAWADMEKAMNLYFAEAAKVLPRPFDLDYSWNEIVKRDRMSVADRYGQIKLSKLQRGMMDAILATCSHNYAEQSSYVEMLRWWALPGGTVPLFWDSLSRYHFKDGTSALIDHIIDEGKPEIRLGTAVNKVEQRSDRAIVTTADGQRLTSRVVVLTVPMNVLKNIQFVPALRPGKLAASRETHSGAGTKAYVEVAGRLGNFFGMAPPPEPISLIWTEHVGPKSTLMVLFGPDPKLLDVNDGDAVRAAVRRFLPNVELLGNYGYDWVADPYSLGTYCSYRPGQVSKYLADMQAHEGRLFYASADNARGWRGFIDGAIEQGICVSRQVTQFLSSVA